jgi:hypothetical protein
LLQLFNFEGRRTYDEKEYAMENPAGSVAAVGPRTGGAIPVCLCGNRRELFFLAIFKSVVTLQVGSSS